MGKESTGGQSPTLYATDRDSYVVQGWRVADAALLAGEETESTTVVEVPPTLMTHLAKSGLDGRVTQVVAPIVRVTATGNYVIQGARVSDDTTLAQMDMPAHESCVEVPASEMRSLVAG
ncbi:hypothetical protein ACQEVC_34350 [Plantactinospora sp. CA-294935]|uniref:hypothetical protein n=1 Tax=Plantactinospora sp. CA-294935 TaxID=3240012 RepID=UPI003D8DD6B7